jgi:hypothetical protein
MMGKTFKYCIFIILVTLATSCQSSTHVWNKSPPSKNLGEVTGAGLKKELFEKDNDFLHQTEKNQELKDHSFHHFHSKSSASHWIGR